MNWKELLKSEIEAAYGSATGLMRMVSDEELDWKPSIGSNWMTVGQLLLHITDACGGSFRGFITGDWGMPGDTGEMSPEEMLPPAEKMKAIGSVAEALDLLGKDKQTALSLLDTKDENALLTQKAPAPWDPSDTPLGYRLLQMVGHLSSHKHQLYYYLKLMGHPVNTGNLWGM